LAAALAVLAVLVAAREAIPSPGPTVAVLVAARTLEAGAALEPADLREVRRPPAEVPDGAVAPADPAYGRRLALPVRSGEVLTDVRLVGPGLLEGLGPDLVAAPVRLADDSAAGVAQVGDLVDVLASGETGYGTVAASSVRVLVASRPDRGSSAGGGSSGGGTSSGAGADTVVLALTSRDAARLAGAAATARLSLVLRPAHP
jgi:pilus assembly protein CpaB